MRRLTPADKGRANARLHLGGTEKVHRVAASEMLNTPNMLQLQSLCLCLHVVLEEKFNSIRTYIQH